MNAGNAAFRVVVLTAVYLLVLTSLHPGDILTGVVVSVLLVAAGRRIRPLGSVVDEPLKRRLAGVPTLVGGTLVDLITSTWRMARWCLSARRTPRVGDGADSRVHAAVGRGLGGYGWGSPRTRWWSSSTRSVARCCCT